MDGRSAWAQARPSPLGIALGMRWGCTEQIKASWWTCCLSNSRWPPPLGNKMGARRADEYE